MDYPVIDACASTEDPGGQPAPVGGETGVDTSSIHGVEVLVDADQAGRLVSQDELYGDDGALYRLIDGSWHEVISGGPPQMEDWELDEEEVRERHVRAAAKWARMHAKFQEKGSPPTRTRPVQPAGVLFRPRLRAPRPTARARQPRRRPAANRRPVAPARLGDAAPPGDGPRPTSRGAAAGGAQ